MGTKWIKVTSKVGETARHGWRKILNPLLLIFLKIASKVFDYINHFFPISPFLYPLKRSENQRFSHLSRGYKKEQWEEMV